ncbi:hypothetical protein IQ266_23465 [filamentous cyanobacterium LEGE 11480]|uniref:Uncharacterized protein n=1 Tax=Romeriopsis navalis LEGE 11480 TaxID=2777977 RepID=A0A928VQL3_9CYAN|nr:hypothetical protein [Romeriopsis navalis LEGE 11480]
MNPLLLRQFWSVVETTQANILLHLDDSTLVRHLTHDLQTQRLLDAEETTAVNHYIESRLPLIRDIAQSRVSPEFCGSAI